MPWSGFCQICDAHRDLLLHQRPQVVRHVVAPLGVQVDRIDDRPVDVVLALVVGAVADPHRPRVVVAAQVVERLLGQVALAADAVHDLQRAVLVAVEVDDELHEVVGLPVEPERVERVEGERGVAHPGVAVVPVALATRRLGQRCRQRRDQRAGRRVGEALQRQRRALQVARPPVVGELAVGQPRAPVVEGVGHRLARPPRPCGRSPRLRPSPRAAKQRSPSHRVWRARTRDDSTPSRRSLARRISCSCAVGSVLAAHVRHAAVLVRGQLPDRRARARSRTSARTRPRARPAPARTRPAGSASAATAWSVGGRVCGPASAPSRQGPMASASRTTSQPLRVFHVVSSTLVPGR